MNNEPPELYRRPQMLVLPELVSLGRYETKQSHLGGARPDGYDGLELGFLESGTVEWWDGVDIDEAHAGSILIGRPGTWQGGKDAIVHPCVRYWLRFEYPLSELPGFNPPMIEDLTFGLDAISCRHFRARTDFARLFNALLAEQRERGQFGEIYSRAIFHEILILTVREHQVASKNKPTAVIAEVMNFATTNLHRQVTVPEIAELFGLSTGYLHERFKREVGVAPARFVQEARVREAKKRLINSDESVTGIALDLGFSTSQWFSTSFRSIVGMAPKEYRALRQSSSPAD